MNKYILIAAIMLVAKGAKGQDVWEVPTDNSTNNTEMKAAKGNKTENGTTKTSLKNPQYLSGAVTEKDGKVVWELNIDLKGKTAQQIYDATIKTFQSYTKQDNQLEGSKIALVNKAEHIIVAQVKEWLVFKDAFLALGISSSTYYRHIKNAIRAYAANLWCVVIPDLIIAEHKLTPPDSPDGSQMRVS